MIGKLHQFEWWLLGAGRDEDHIIYRIFVIISLEFSIDLHRLNVVVYNITSTWYCCHRLVLTKSNVRLTIYRNIDSWIVLETESYWGEGGFWHIPVCKDYPRECQEVVSLSLWLVMFIWRLECIEGASVAELFRSFTSNYLPVTAVSSNTTKGVQFFHVRKLFSLLVEGW